MASEHWHNTRDAIVNHDLKPASADLAKTIAPRVEIFKTTYKLSAAGQEVYGQKRDNFLHDIAMIFRYLLFGFHTIL